MLTPHFTLWLGIQRKPLFIPSLRKTVDKMENCKGIDDNVITGRNSLRSSLFHRFFLHITLEQTFTATS